MRDINNIEKKLKELEKENENLRLELSVAEGRLNALNGFPKNNLEGIGINITEREMQAEDALLRSEKRYRMLHESLRDAFVQVAMNGKIIEFNELFCQMLGYSPDEISRLTYQDLTPKRWHNFEHKIVQEQIIPRGYSEVYKKEYRRKNGEIFPVELRTILSYDDEGKPDTMWAIVRDITEHKRTAEKILENERKLSDIYNSMSEGLAVHEIIYDHSGKAIDYLITEVNPAFENITGIKCHSNLKKKATELYAVEKAPYLDIYSEVVATGKPVTFEVFFPPLKKHFLISAFSPDKGKFVTVFHDITDRKKKEQELKKLNQTLRALDKCSQAMVRAADEINFLNDVCKIIVEDCNYSMVWIGYAQEDESKTIKPMVYSGFDKGYLDTLNLTWADTERGRGPTGSTIRTGKISICKNMLTDPNFSPWREQALKRGYASSISVPLIANGKPFGAITIYAKEPDPFYEEEINLLSELGNDIAYGITAIRWRIAKQEAENKLKKSAIELKELNATKDKFFGIIAHDLKNPFSSLLGLSELLLEDHSKYTSENIREFSEMIYKSAKKGYSLLENLLEWSMSQTGRFAFNPVQTNVKELAQNVISNIESLSMIKNIRLECQISDKLIAPVDGNMLTTVLRNLVNNAIKFTHIGGKITLSAIKREDCILFTVKDTGIGIPKDDISKLFRIDIKYMGIGTAKEIGTGLGLILCKEFVEKHGGEIWAESEPGKGCEFKFTIPVKRSPQG